MRVLPRPVLSAATLSAALCWAAVGAAAPAAVDPAEPEPAHTPTAPLSSPALAAERAQLERPNPLQARAAPEPERASLRLSVGLGGGSVGVAARGAVDIEYWALEHAGIGLLGAAGGQSAVLGDSFSYAFIGPALTLRGSATGEGLFATAAFGFMNGNYTRSEGLWCENVSGCDVESSIRAPGVVLNAGLTGRAGSVHLGGGLAVDLISAQLTENVRWLNTVTLNVIASLPL